jgi:gentisate 1,2-dioxygenase
MTTSTERAPAERAEWTSAAQYFEYSRAANPIGAGLIPYVPLADFPHEIHESGPTRVIPFDLSDQLRCPGPATSPALLSNFVRIEPGESIGTNPNATSELYYVIRGRGRTEVAGRTLTWSVGDIFTLSCCGKAIHRADEDAAFYWVHDEPLLRYLGAKADRPRFEPTLYPRARAAEELEKVTHDPQASQRNRVSVLLANAEFPQTRTITHVLWAMFGVLPQGKVQPPHHHESVALDLIIDCQPGCYSLIGTDIDDDGNIRDARRADWKPGSAFVTPPGLWHSHHNESGADAHLLPIQDAGLHTYLRTLDIHFYQSNKDKEAFISLKAGSCRRERDHG